MNATLLLAAIIMTVTVGVHVFLGGPVIMRPLRQSPLPRLVRTVADVVWHGVTVTLICLAGALFWLTWHDNPALLWMTCAIQFGFAGLFIWYGVTQLRSLWPMPQWILFLGIPALTIWGAG
ncbi:MAG: hypothetical protein ACI8R4_002406 [Paracoccaceae bacterium]|jgi:hypothetical protein